MEQYLNYGISRFFEDDDLQESILDKEFEESLSEVKAQVLLEKFLDCYYSNYQSFKDEFDYKKPGNRIYVYLHDGPVVYYDMVENKIGLSKREVLTTIKNYQKSLKKLSVMSSFCSMALAIFYDR